MPQLPSIYQLAYSPQGALRQGEILSNVSEFRAYSQDTSGRTIEVKPIVWPFAVVLSQTCDLEFDWEARQNPSNEVSTLENVLMCTAHTAAEVRVTSGINGTIWTQIRKNEHKKYQFLESCPQGADCLNEGFEELTVDFRNLFTVSLDVMYKKIAGNEWVRRTVLTVPYREELATRAFACHARIAVPAPHRSS